MSRKSKKPALKKSVAAAIRESSAAREARGAEYASPAAADDLEGPAWRSRETIVICALLAILVFLVFGRTLHYEFINYDDDGYVYQNAEVLKGLTPGGVAQAFTHKDGGLWTPLVAVSHMLDFQLHGLNAGGHHLTNVLLHLASTILLFLILRAMTGAPWRSAFVAALFAIHPLHVESVAWIAERKDVLSGLFFMLTLGAYLRYVQRPGSPWRYLTVIILFAMGLMCKPMLVTLPFVLLLVDYWPLKRLFQPSPDGGKTAGWFSVNRRAVLEKIPLLALSAWLCVSIMTGRGETGYNDIVPVPFRTRMCEAPVWCVMYVGQMIRPAGLAVIYTHDEESLRWWPAALVLLGVVTAGVFLLRRKHPYLLMGWLWNLGMLVPVCGIVQISRHARADHYNYLPQIGLYAGLTWLAVDLTAQWQHRRVALGSAAGAVLCGLLVAACTQVAWWRDSITLWTHTLECTEDNSIAHNNLGMALSQQGRRDEAMGEFREALRIDPVYVKAHNNLGNAFFQSGQAEEAATQFREALQTNPEYAEAHNGLGTVLSQQGHMEEAMTEFREALRIKPDYAEACNGFGVAFFRLGRTEEAVAQFREALRIKPAYATAHNGLGVALFQLGRADEAIAEYREAVRINPSYAEAGYNLGNVLSQQGREQEAMGYLQEALNLQPANAAFQNSLALLLATAPEDSLRDGARAMELAVKANQASGGNDPGILRTLAAAYAEAGDFARAVETAQRALVLANGRGNVTLGGTIRGDVGLYRNRTPLRIGK